MSTYHLLVILMLRFVTPIKPVLKPTVEDSSIYLWCSTKQNIVQLRRKWIIQTILALFELTIFIFITTSLYLGFGSDPNRYAKHLHVIVIDLDQDLAGKIFLNSFQQVTMEDVNLNWQFKSPNDVNRNIDQIRQDFEREGSWAIVLLHGNTTRQIDILLNQWISDATIQFDESMLRNASVLVSYEEGRNAFTINNYVLPSIRTAISRASTHYGKQLRETLIKNVSSSSLSSVQLRTQLNNLMHMNSFLVDPFSAHYDNRHPASPFVGKSFSSD